MRQATRPGEDAGDWIGAGRVAFATNTDEGGNSIGVFDIGKGLKVGDAIPKDHPKELFLVLDFLNIAGLERLEIALGKVRAKLEMEQG